MRETNRRDFVKTSGTVLGAGGATGISRGSRLEAVTVGESSLDIDLGRTLFVETSLEYQGGPEYPILQRCGVPGHSLDARGELVSLVDAPVASFAGSDAVLSINDGYISGTAPRYVLSGKPRAVPVSTSPNGFVHKGLVTASDAEKSPSVLEIEVSSGTNRAVVDTGSQTVTIRPGSSQDLRLEPREMRVPSRSDGTREIDNPRELGPERIEVPEPDEIETIELEPVLSVRNHGSVHCLGAEDLRIYPKRPRDEFARARVSDIDSSSGVHDAGRQVLVEGVN